MEKLIIEDLEVIPLQVPLKKIFQSSLGVYTHLDVVVVKMETKYGPQGIGVTTGLGGAAGTAIVPYIKNELSPLVIGEDALSPELIWAKMWGPNKARMRGGMGLHALSCVDIACWDVLAKAAGQPINRLLGGFKQSIPVYGSGGWHTLSDEELLEEAEETVSLGCTAYKLKIGTNRDEDRISFLREKMGEDFILFADANQKYNVREAIEVSNMLAEYGVAWFEEPVIADSVDDLAALAKVSMVPLAVGENSYMRWGFRELCEKRAVGFLQPDVGRCGGITEFRKIANLADAFNISLSCHLVHEISVSLIGASPSGYMAEYMDFFKPEDITQDFSVKNGKIAVPDVPGHGFEFTDNALKNYRID
ncbi:MAG: mandelate racemase/muconate lactonizing enzyme family protein [Nitrospinota bacterium]|nr:mandelate racemase/muconate lactonizing enzyme family protein [Nitrospinota bacterium]